jgi:crossover junction endodeoxyribonuclease RuvC
VGDVLVLGVDPGTQTTGYGAVARRGGRFVCVDAGIIRPPRAHGLGERLLLLHDALDRLVAALMPDVIAVEDCFYSENVRSTLKLGHVKGLVLVVAARYGKPVFEYPPRRVKQAVVGSGGATKEQVRFMIERMIVRTSPPSSVTSLDSTDAMAVAICHHHSALAPALAGVVR